MLQDDWWKDYVDLYVIHRARCVRSFTPVLTILVPTHGTTEDDFTSTILIMTSRWSLVFFGPNYNFPPTFVISVWCLWLVQDYFYME